MVREPTDQMRAHTRRRRAKRPSTTRWAATAHNCPVQKHVLPYDPKRQEQITTNGIAYELVDITVDGAARDYVTSLGYLQVPVVVTPTAHWSGFRPDRLSALAA